jgi:hypothetical protein
MFFSKAANLLTHFSCFNDVLWLLISEWKKKVSSTLAYLQVKVDDILEICATFQKGSQTSDDVLEGSGLLDYPNVLPPQPLTFTAELEELERKLVEKSSYDYLVGLQFFNTELLVKFYHT